MHARWKVRWAAGTVVAKPGWQRGAESVAGAGSATGARRLLMAGMRNEPAGLVVRSMRRTVQSVAAVLLLVGLSAESRCAAQTDPVVTLRTPPLIADSTGSLRCVALNLTDRPLGITAEIMDADGNNVTDFIRTMWQDDAGSALAEVISASFHNPAARYCLITVKGGTARDVAGVFVRYDGDGSAVTQRRAR